MNKAKSFPFIKNGMHSLECLLNNKLILFKH